MITQVSQLTDQKATNLSGKDKKLPRMVFDILMLSADHMHYHTKGRDKTVWRGSTKIEIGTWDEENVIRVSQ